MRTMRHLEWLRKYASLSAGPDTAMLGENVHDRLVSKDLSLNDVAGKELFIFVEPDRRSLNQTLGFPDLHAEILIGG